MRRGVKKLGIAMMAMTFVFGLVSLDTLAAEKNVDMQTNVAEVCIDVEEPGVVTTGVRTGTLGDNNGIQWTYDESMKTLTVTGEDSGVHGYFDFNELSERSPFYYICSDVEKIILQNCVLIGDAECLFYGLQDLKEILFINFDTSKITSMRSMFSGCANLSDLNLSEFDTSSVQDMDSMFKNCYSLTQLDVSSFNTSNVIFMSDMFCNTGITSIDLHNFDTSNVIYMDGMFSSCFNLESLDLSSFNTSKVTNMSYMFGNSSIEEIDISNFDTSNVIYMESMFSYCTCLTNLDVSNFDTSNVESMAWMYQYCYELKSLDLSSFDTSNVIYMSGMFSGCKNLTDLDVSNFDTSNTIYMNSMLEGCNNLQNLDLSSFDITNVTNMSDMFLECDALGVIETPNAMATGQSIALPDTFYDSQRNIVTEITPSTCNKIIVTIEYIPDWQPGSRTIEIIADSTEATVEGRLQLLLKIDGVLQDASVNKNYKWFVESKDVVAVSGTGAISGKGMGETTITCVHKVDELETASYDIVVRIPFSDITTTDWQYPFVVYAYENNLMSGKSEQNFDMNGKLTRAEFVTVLYSYSGKPGVTYEQQFSDVASGAWYANAVTWAKQNGVTAGNPNGTFGVNDKITREQLVVMLYQYAKNTGIASGEISGDLTAYADEGNVSTWARESFVWAVQNGVIGGKNSNGVNKLDPQGSTTRGECATMMMRYVELAK